MNDIYLYAPSIMLAYAAFLLGVMSPGPNILAVIGTSMSQGRKSGTALAMGIAIGSFTWGLLSAIGLTALLDAYASALFIIKIIGGGYLIWLGYKSLRSAASTYDLSATNLTGDKHQPKDYFIRGYLIQMTNPKAALTWVAIITLGLQPDAPIWVGLAIVVGATILSIVMHGLYAIAFSTDIMVRIYSRFRQYIQAFLGLFFIAAGIKLISGR